MINTFNIKKKILIIDDDSRNIFALKAVLQAKKFQCLSASSAAEGISILKSSDEVGMILMDMMMPYMDGYEAIAVIRSDEKIANIPIIAVTAQAMVGDKDKCLEAGANGYISKPVNIDELLILIKENLQER